MPARSEAESLCATCRVATHCAYPRPPGEPVRYCDDFEPFPFGATSHERRRTIQMALPTEAAEQPGLCATCERQGDCRLPRPLGGVWHCEEYC